MAVVTHVNASPVFDLRSAAFTLVVVVLKTTDLAELARELRERFSAVPDLFDGDPIAIDLSHVRDDATPIDFERLIALLREYRMAPIAAKGGSAAHMAAAQAAGLVEAPAGGLVPQATTRSEAGALAPAPADDPKAAGAEALAAADAVAAGENAATNPGAAAKDTAKKTPAGPPQAARSSAAADGAATAHETAAGTPAAASTMVVDRPLRSGQRVYAKGCDLVVLAVVSFGAEVMADGSIHVYAPLRGRAMAGVAGNAAARIFTTCLEPQLVSIAGLYRTAEAGWPDDVYGKPAQIRLDGEKILIEALAQ
ncbi:MAG TPA: septum site-determining protein MinC [Burkholderiaceae bacterium]|nr:septum site-determining protein MinC [Burkholderiaceae bacterium]